MLEQEQAGCTLVGKVGCDLLDIFLSEQTHEITGQGTKLRRFLGAQVTQCQRRDVALLIFLDNEEIKYADDAFLSRSAEFRQNLACESIALKTNN
jgi:hypothetical protein